MSEFRVGMRIVRHVTSFRRRREDNEQEGVIVDVRNTEIGPVVVILYDRPWFSATRKRTYEYSEEWLRKHPKKWSLVDQYEGEDWV